MPIVGFAYQTWEQKEREVSRRAVYDVPPDPSVDAATEFARQLRAHRGRIAAAILLPEHMPREVALDMERGWTPEQVRRLVRDYVSLVDRVSSLRPTE